MAVRVVEVLSPVESSVVTTTNATVIEVLNTAKSPITTTSGLAVVEVVGQNVVQNAYVSATPPAFPYEGQVWIDIS